MSKDNEKIRSERGCLIWDVQWELDTRILRWCEKRQEVWEALEEYGLSENKEKVKQWYDGFIFGKQREIYNPWSITNYLKTQTLSSYWTNSSSNRLVGTLIQEGSKNLKISFERLLQGESITTEMDEQIVYDQLNEEAAVWSLLLASGYLKVEKFEAYMTNFGEWKQEYELKLTNFEVKVMFRNMVRNGLTMLLLFTIILSKHCWREMERP